MKDLAIKLNKLSGELDEVDPIVSAPGSWREYYAIAEKLRQIADEIEKLGDKYESRYVCGKED